MTQDQDHPADAFARAKDEPQSDGLPGREYSNRALSSRQEVVWGEWEYHESLVVADRARLEAIASDISILRSCSTYGAVKAAFRDLSQYSWLNEDDLAEYEDDDSFEYSENTPGVPDGDWPPMPTAAILSLFPSTDFIWDDLIDDAIGGGLVSTTLNGDYFHIDVEKADALVAVLQKHRISATRDDDLITRSAE